MEAVLSLPELAWRVASLLLPSLAARAVCRALHAAVPHSTVLEAAMDVQWRRLRLVGPLSEEQQESTTGNYGSHRARAAACSAGEQVGHLKLGSTAACERGA